MASVIGTDSRDDYVVTNGNAYFGLGGDDVFVVVPDSGTSAIDGGPGSDWLQLAGFVNQPAPLFSVHLSTGEYTVFGGGGSGAHGALFSIENVGGHDASDLLTGNSADNRLQGLGGDDFLKGGGGADTFEGGMALTGFGLTTLLRPVRLCVPCRSTSQ
jgi:Ca2+-binding RTX toxin-like protein